jgi:hypothetical protein
MASTARFQMRPDDEGWTVFDNWTGLAVVIAGVAQTGIELMDADELTELLQRRADQGDRRIYE